MEVSARSPLLVIALACQTCTSSFPRSPYHLRLISYVAVIMCAGIVMT